mmetsp:Transcript_90140/g.250404  ORF Transcript_90140/g.250404 Transcript_90140/m.250404 type:complete len:302 (-) Transcript_90140:160-1065(-)
MRLSTNRFRNSLPVLLGDQLSLHKSGLDELRAHLHGHLVGSLSRLVGSKGLHRQAAGLPATKAPRQDPNVLQRACLLAVPISTLRCPVCGILASEDNQLLVSPLSYQVRNLHDKGDIVYSLHMDRTLNEARRTVLAPQVHQNALLLTEQVERHQGLNVLNSHYRWNSVGTCGRDVWLATALRHGGRCARRNLRLLLLCGTGCTGLLGGPAEAKGLLLNWQALDKLGAKSHREVISLLGRFSLHRRLHGEANGLPTAETAREDRDTLLRRRLLSVPVRALGCAVGRVLAGEDNERPVRPLLR